MLPGQLPAKIRPASPADLPALVRALGQAPYFADRLDRQARGDGALLAAWADATTVVGVVYLWLAPAEERPIRTHLPGVPLLTHLEVVGSYRNHGIGTRLIAATEAEATSRRRTRLALAVVHDNLAAERLYKDLDYREWPHGEVECIDYETHHPERCRILVKCLPLRCKRVLAAIHQAKFGDRLQRLKPLCGPELCDMSPPLTAIPTPRSQEIDTQSRLDELTPFERGLERQ